MSTDEKRLSALERKVSTIQLERMHEQLVERETTPTEEAFREMDHHLTMLLDVASSQNQDLKGVISAIHTLDDRLASLEQSVNSRFEAQDKKLDQVLFLLNTLLPRSE